jgi:type III restriction enzyme
MYDARVTQRLGDPDVVSHVLHVFVPLIRQRTTEEKKRLDEGKPVSLANWKLYKASHSQRNPCKPAAKTMFNLVPCRGGWEDRFTEFLALKENGVTAFAKNGGPQSLRIDYVRVNGQLSTYTPDFFVRDGKGTMYLVETKGREDLDVPRKAKAAIAWCGAASNSGTSWKYIYLPEIAADSIGTGSWPTVVAAAATYLDSLLEREKVEKQAPLFAMVLNKEEKVAIPALVPQAELDALSPALKKTAEEALLMYDFLSKRPNPNFAPAFTGMLGAVDSAARKLLIDRLMPAVPTMPQDQRVFFDSYLVGQGKMPPNHYERVIANLRKSLLYNAGMMPIGLLRDCLDYALNDTARFPGVLEAARNAFRFEGSRKLLAEIAAVYDFRNKYIAHQEVELSDPPLAAKELGRWVRLLDLMSTAANAAISSRSQ